MTDIRLPVGDTIFALRTALVCVQDGKVLVIRGEGLGFKYLPGGAVAVGETFAQAAKREWIEETGLLFGTVRLLGIVENFFELGGKHWHELDVFYRLDAARSPLDGNPVLDQPGQFWEWHDPTLPSEHPVHPVDLLKLLAVPEGQALQLVRQDVAIPLGPDLRLPVGGVEVQVRVHLLYVQNEHLLTNTVPGSDFWFLPGGSVRLGENSLDAALREFYEETGVKAAGARLVGFTEGFDRQAGRQQLGLCYRMDSTAPLPPHTFPVQDHDRLQMEWLPLDELERLRVEPRRLRQMLDLPEGQIEHSVVEW